MTQDRLDIRYPVRWTYKVIGSDEDRLRDAIGAVVGEAEHTISYSHTSSGGRYISLTADVVVESEDQRNHLFGQLGSHTDVRVVI